MLANRRVRLLPNGVRCARADHDCSQDKCDSSRSSSARALEINNTGLFGPYTILGSKQISEGPVLVLGLAYKSGISMTSGSKSIELLRHLKEKGHDAIGYDPNINPEEASSVSDRIYTAVIVTTDEPCFNDIVVNAKQRNPNVLILDHRMTKGFSVNPPEPSRSREIRG